MIILATRTYEIMEADDVKTRFQHTNLKRDVNLEDS